MSRTAMVFRSEVQFLKIKSLLSNIRIHHTGTQIAHKSFLQLTLSLRTGHRLCLVHDKKVQERLISIYFSNNIKQKCSKIIAILQKSVSYNCIPPSQVTQHTSRTIFQKINISKTDYNESLPKRRFCRRNKIPYKIQRLRR